VAVNHDHQSWTYGAEHEFCNWDRSVPLPDGVSLDSNERTMMNADGAGVDPKGKLTKHGGEFLIGPVGSIDALAETTAAIVDRHRDCRINNRSGLHIHIHVPGLIEDVQALKLVQSYIHTDCRNWQKFLDPIDAPCADDFDTADEYKGAQRRHRRLVASHHTMVSDHRVKAQMEAKTPEEFFEAEVRDRTGRLVWHLQRPCVNLRHLRQTQTIEFRHWFATLDPERTRQCALWCREFLRDALRQEPDGIDFLFKTLKPQAPPCEPYVHWRDLRYWATAPDGSVKRDELERNHELIREGKFPIGPQVESAILRQWPESELLKWRV